MLTYTRISSSMRKEVEMCAYVCECDMIYNTPNSSAKHSLVRHKKEEMEYLQNHVLKAVSSIQDILHVITTLFECVKKESDGMISNIKELREETYDITSDLHDDITILQKKIDSLNIEIDNINKYADSNGLIISGNIIPLGTATENCKDIVLNLFCRHLNINLNEEELTDVYRIGKIPANGVDNREIFFNTSRKQLSYRIFQASCDLNPPFYINYYSEHTRRKIDYIICQLKTKFPEKIMGFHSYNNETCILYNICDYSTNNISTFEWIETKNQTIGEPKNQIMDETWNRRVHVSIKTMPDLERFVTLYHNAPIYNKTSIHFKTYDNSSNTINSYDEDQNINMNETGHGILYVSIKTLSDLENFVSMYLNTTITSYI